MALVLNHQEVNGRKKIGPAFRTVSTSLHGKGPFPIRTRSISAGSMRVFKLYSVRNDLNAKNGNITRATQELVASSGNIPE
jgi:hypothetical protein